MAATAETIAAKHLDLGLQETTPSSNPISYPLCSISPDYAEGAETASRTAAHVARNPLTITLGYTQLEILRGSIPPDVGARLVKSLEQAISGLNQLQDKVNAGDFKTVVPGIPGDVKPIFDLGVQRWENRPADPSSRFSRSRTTGTIG